MCLIHQRNGEEAFNAAVCPFHGIGIGRVERALMLVDQYAVFGQCLVAVAIELLGKQPLANAKRIGGIHNNQIIFVFHTADKPQPILVVNVDPRVVQTACRKRQILLCQMHYQLVDFHHVDLLNGGITAQLPHRAAVTGANDQNLFDVRVGRHGNVGNHFVVDVLVFFGYHQQSVQRHNASEFHRVKHVDSLKFALHTGKLPVNANGEPDVIRVIFGIPDVHIKTPFTLPFPLGFLDQFSCHMLRCQCKA